MNKKIRSNSMAFKLAVAFIVSVVVQSILVAGTFVYGGVIKESRENAYQIFSEKVNSRADNIEGEMKNVWTNFEHYTKQISEYFTQQNAADGSGTKTTEEILEDMAPVVMDAMYYTKTTGTFLILKEESGEERSHPALYFRNVNPSLNDDKNSNIYLLVGPWRVSEKMDVVTDAQWNFQLKLDDSNSAFYEKPFQSMGLADDNTLLGYWSGPFRVTPEGDEVITYSVPLMDENGNSIGVFGVEIAVEYLYKFLPTADLKANDSYGYILGIQQQEGGGIQAMVTHGALQKRVLDSGSQLELKMQDEKNQIYNLENHKNKHKVYVCLSEMGMYYNNTPFSGEKWYLVGMMDESSLLEYPDRIKEILIYSLLGSLVAGIFVAMIISKWFTKYSRLIELSEVPIGVFEMNGRNKKVHMTNQVPKLLEVSREQEQQFYKNKECFKEFLEKFCENETDEVNVYRTGSQKEQKWIRITMKSEGETVTGIVEDVTDEILQKKDLKKERDHDGLTGIKNRRAFKQAAEMWNELLTPETKLCVMMFDLNGLKEVNDVYGHNKGDEYICYASESIQKSFPESQIFRIGGDEFAAIRSGIPEEKVKEYGKALHERMEMYRRHQHQEAGVAWGYAYYNAGTDENFEQILSRADMNMYENKRKMKQ